MFSGLQGLNMSFQYGNIKKQCYPEKCLKLSECIKKCNNERNCIEKCKKNIKCQTKCSKEWLPSITNLGAIG